MFCIPFISSCGKDIKIKLPKINLKFGDPVVLTLELKQMIKVGGKFAIPDLKDSYVELIPTNAHTNAPAMVILSIRADQFENDHFKLHDPTLLPDGRPLPKIQGKIPSLAIEVPELYNITFYLGIEVAAMFIPTTINFEQDAEITLPFSDSSGREVGFLTRIPTINGQHGGFFVSFNWSLAVSNPNDNAVIREEDLRHAFINDPRAKKWGYESGKPVDLSNVFVLP